MSSLKIYNHRELVANWDTYCQLADFEDGRVERVAGYLVPYRSEADGTAEGAANFANRQKRLYNVNHCSPYLFIHWGHMSQPITYTGMDGEPMQAIRADATGYREDAEEVMRARLWSYMRDGRVGCFVDGPAATQPDREGARAAHERSYQINYEARRIRDWEYFTSGPRKGQLSKVLLEEESSRSSDGKFRARYRLLTHDGSEGAMFQWAILEEEAEYGVRGIMGDAIPVKVIDSGPGGIDRIPFRIIGCGPDESFLKDVMPLNKIHLNLSSVLSNIIYNQGFQRSIFAGVSKEEVSKAAEWVITLIQNADAKVFTLDPGNPDACFKEIERLERQIHRRAKFEFNQLSDDTRAVQSAESKALDQVARVAIYNATLDMFEQAEADIYQFHAMIEGQDHEDITASIARNYGLDDKAAANAESQMLFTLAGSIGVEALQKEVLKILAMQQRFIPNEGEDEDAVRARILLAIQTGTKPGSSALEKTRDLGLNFFGANGADDGDPQAE